MDHQTKQAVSNLQAFVTVGLVLGIAGGIILAFPWPSTEAESGSGLGVAFGFLVAWIGNVMLLVGLIGWGVKIGREASPTAAPSA